MLPKGGVAGKLMAPAKSILGRVGKVAGIGKAISKTGIKGVAKAGKLASKAKWLGKAAKLSKFGGKLLPGVGTALSVWETVGHIKNGNYGRAALSGISAVGSLIPGVGTVVSGVADAIGTGWDIFSAWRRRKAKKQEEKAEETKKENRRQKETVQQMTARALSGTKAKGESQTKSDKIGAMASKVDTEIKKADKPQPKKQGGGIVGLAKTAFKYTTPIGLGWMAWKNRDKIGKAANTIKNKATSGVKKGVRAISGIGKKAAALASTARKKATSIVKNVAGTIKGKVVEKASNIAKVVKDKSGQVAALASTARKAATSIVKNAAGKAAKLIKSAKNVAPQVLKKAAGLVSKILPVVPGFNTPLVAASSLWRNRKKITEVTGSIKSKISGITQNLGSTKVGQVAKKLTGSGIGRIAKAAIGGGGKFIRSVVSAASSTPQNATTVQTSSKPEVHTNPTVTAIKEKPQITQQAKSEASETTKLGDIFTDQLSKTRDADIAQTKDMTETFKTELEKVCSLLAQIGGILPSLQPAPPPPVQQVMEGNKVPEFRKHNLEAIA